MRCDPTEVSSAKERAPRQSQEIHFLVNGSQNEIALALLDVILAVVGI
ncbi:MAG: hypothetical protein ACFCU5_05545 [Pleurocapsa sp.]